MSLDCTKDTAAEDLGPKTRASESLGTRERSKPHFLVRTVDTRDRIGRNLMSTAQLVSTTNNPLTLFLPHTVLRLTWRNWNPTLHQQSAGYTTRCLGCWKQEPPAPGPGRAHLCSFLWPDTCYCRQVSSCLVLGCCYYCTSGRREIAMNSSLWACGTRTTPPASLPCSRARISTMGSIDDARSHIV